MPRLAVGLSTALALLSTGCYLSHRIGEDADGSTLEDAPLSRRACCIAVRCGPEGEICAGDEECGPNGCAPSCDGARCGAACCGAEQLCIAEACVDPGPPCRDDAACATGERCDPLGLRCVPEPSRTCMEPRPFEPVLRWEDTSVMAINVPLVVPLDDDAAADIVVVTVPPQFVDEARGPARSSLVAFSGDDGRRLWELEMWTAPCSHSPPAAADVDGDGHVEILVLARQLHPHSHPVVVDPDDDPPLRDPCDVPLPSECPPFPPDSGPVHFHDGDPRYRPHVHSACMNYGTAPGALAVVSHRGEVERVVPLPITPRPAEMDAISVADLDADGVPEIVTLGLVIDAEGIRWSDERLSGVGTAIGDLDGDGLLEIVTAQHAFEHDGTLRWSAEEADATGHPVIADVMRDPISRGPQVVVVDGSFFVVRDGATGEPLLGPVRYAGGITAGPPTIADFDGDGLPEIGVMADHGYVVFDPDILEPPYVRWIVRSDDHTPGSVGASAFDFDGDGAADVAFSDECHARILSGRDGHVLWARSNLSLTVWEYPVVADVDGDGAAELVVVSNRRRTTQAEEYDCDRRADPYVGTPGGVRVFEDRLGNWGATRAIWNQHGYHVDNVLDDGRVPVEAPRSWPVNGTWRASPRYPDERDVHSPSLVVTALRIDPAGCGDDATLGARVENHGSRASAAGAQVVFRAGGRELGSGPTTRTLLPGAGEWVALAPIHRTRLTGALRAVMEDPSPCAAGERAAQLDVECTRP